MLTSSMMICDLNRVGAHTVCGDSDIGSFYAYAIGCDVDVVANVADGDYADDFGGGDAGFSGVIIKPMVMMLMAMGMMLMSMVVMIKQVLVLLMLA
ncbi:hypothetical protein DPMN_052398 [Dreissena polymorpha]|uniref:Uncharacterized protein n=1 Tax=Dreissena polymorpha TaxID=45954 RepID=A0A9D4CLW5_DREPO|nr:hypothetical protein DPMN_052398 [Dreissena polymorpha]